MRLRSPKEFDVAMGFTSAATGCDVEPIRQLMLQPAYEGDLRIERDRRRAVHHGSDRLLRLFERAVNQLIVRPGQRRRLLSSVDRRDAGPSGRHREDAAQNLLHLEAGVRAQNVDWCPTRLGLA